MNTQINITELIGASKPIWSESVSYTKKPNVIFDDVMGQISGNAYKCLDVIVRCTYGYHKPSAQISESAFMEFTGIKRKETLRSAIRELEQVKIVEITRKTGVVNNFKITPNQYENLAPGLKNSTSTKNPSQTSTKKPSQTSTKKPSPNKENLKENFKEIYPLESEQKKSSVDDVLNLWIPNLSSLNAWLQRAGEKAMSQDEVNHWLVEINAHYEPKIKVGLVSENQMYSNFVKWVKRNYKKPKHSQRTEKPQSAKQQRDDAWADYYAKRNQQQPNNVIDVIEVQHD